MKKLDVAQCRGLLGGLIGCLCTMTDRDTVKAAVKLWGDNLAVIDAMPDRAAIEAAVGGVDLTGPGSGH